LTTSDVVLQDWPDGKQPTGSLGRVEDCVGRALTVPLVQGAVFLDQELAKRDEGAGLAVTIPAGMRAVSVGVDDVVAVAGFVTPGTIVDVLVTGTGPGGPVTRTILEHVRVLAVGQELQAENPKPQIAPVVTLLVNPQDAEKLTLASADGKIHLALRNTVDTADVSPPPVYGSAIFPGATPPAVRKVVTTAAHATPPWPVQVIRGDKVENQSFPVSSPNPGVK
jgi:pilus assembly protein CpaB